MRALLRSVALVGLTVCMLWAGPGCGESTGQGEKTQEPAREDIRPANASTWYPEDPAALKRQVQGFLLKADAPPVRGAVVGIVVPHAGYVYSGQVAAYAFKQLEGKTFDTVVLIGPSHVETFGGCSVYTRGAYETPLGVVPVDVPLARQIASMHPKVFSSDKGHRQEHLPRREHALENELPFLQIVLKEFKLVPIVMGDQTWESCEALGTALGEALKGKRALVVASTDLSHFHGYDAATKLDRAATDGIRSLDARGFWESLGTGECEACGGAAVVATMIAVQKLGADTCEVLQYANSGDVTGDKRSVVGYAACVLYNRGGSMGRIEYSPLDEAAQKGLLDMARAALERYAREEKIPKFKPTSKVLEERRGVFVTLTEQGRLRGCIGHHEGDTPLYKLVPEMAVAAGFQDPRFPPVTEAELDRIKIKVSVYLTNVYELDDINDFEMGKQGIIMRKGFRAATYLPEVPIEAGWKTKEEELASLCMKAGLPQDAWREGARFEVYETQVFGEE